MGGRGALLPPRRGGPSRSAGASRGGGVGRMRRGIRARSFSPFGRRCPPRQRRADEGSPLTRAASQGHPRLRGGRLLSRKGRGSGGARTRRPSPARGLVQLRFKEPIEGRGTPKRSIILVWRAFRRPRDASPPSSSGSTRGPRPRCTTSGLPRHGRRFWTGPAARHGTRGLAEASPRPSRDGSTPPASRPLSLAAQAPGPYYPEGGAGPAPRVRVRETRPQAPHPLPLL
jgi:hypothetical protein